MKTSSEKASNINDEKISSSNRFSFVQNKNQINVAKKNLQ